MFWFEAKGVGSDEIRKLMYSRIYTHSYSYNFIAFKLLEKYTN